MYATAWIRVIRRASRFFKILQSLASGILLLIKKSETIDLLCHLSVEKEGKNTVLTNQQINENNRDSEETKGAYEIKL